MRAVNTHAAAPACEAGSERSTGRGAGERRRERERDVVSQRVSNEGAAKEDQFETQTNMNTTTKERLLGFLREVSVCLCVRLCYEHKHKPSDLCAGM